MQGIYSYIPESKHVYRIYSVAAVLYLQFVLKVMLFRPINIYYYNIITNIVVVVVVVVVCRSQWPRGLRRRSTAARLLRSWVRIPQGA